MVEFIGRTELLALLGEVVVPGEFVALVGPSGVGKTALARHWLAQHEGQLRVATVDGFHRSPMEVAAELLATAGEVPEARLDEDEVWASAAQALEGFDIVFVDDVDFPMASLQRLFRIWDGAILVTTHQPPAGGGVKAVPVAPFDTDEDITDSDAARLFASASTATDIRFDPYDSPRALEALLDACDGFPLAIILAAQWSATLSCETVLKLLDEGSYPEDGDNPRRHRSMQAAIHFSWNQLAQAQRARLYAMSLLAAPVAVATVSELCDEPQIDTARGLHQLVQMSMIGRGPQHRPLSSFCEHALKVFAEQNPQRAEAIEQRLIELATHRAHREVEALSMYDVPDQSRHLWQAAIGFAPRIEDRDLGVVLAMWLHWLAFRVSSEERSRRIEKAQPLFERADDWHAWYWLAKLRRHERDQRVGEVIERAKTVAQTPEQRRDILLDEAQFHYLNLRLDEAVQTLEMAIEEATPTFFYYYQRAELQIYRGRKADAFESAERAEALLEPDQEIHRARLEMMRSLCETEPARKQARIERARDIYRRHHMLAAQGWCAHWLANTVGREQDRFDEAVVLFDEAREHYKSVGRQREREVIDTEEALLELHTGNWDRAIELSQAVEDRITDNDLLPMEPVRLVRGVAALQSGALSAAEGVWRSDRSYWTSASHVYLKALFVAFDAAMSVEIGDPEAAREAIEQADDEVALRLHALLALDAYDTDDLDSALEIWPKLRPALIDRTGASVAARQLTIRLRANLPPMLTRLHRLEDRGQGVRFVDDFRAFFVEDEWVDIRTQTTARTMLRALCTADDPVDFEDFAELLYSDQTLTRQSLVNRVNVQISKLRHLGLKEHLIKLPDGFVFEGDFTLD